MFNNIYYSIAIIIFEANVNTDVIYLIDEFFPVRVYVQFGISLFEFSRQRNQ